MVQHDNTANMIYAVAQLFAFLSSFITLEPGDLIATSTPSGVGDMRQPPLFLHHGDRVEVEGIGFIRHPVIAPPRAESNE